MSYVIKEGYYNNLGVEITSNGIVFTFEADRNMDCSIVLLDANQKKVEEINVPKNFCIGNWRSVLVVDLKAEELNYYYLIDKKKVVDPYASRILGRDCWNDGSRIKNKYAVSSSLSCGEYDWGEDIRPNHSKDSLSIYKLNVRSFSMDQKGGRKHAGTFKAVAEKLTYIKELGFSAIEFMPVYEFEEMLFDEAYKVKNVNMWGYAPGNYFSVKASYATDASKADVELKDLIKSMHANNMEAIIEIIFDQGTKASYILDVLRFWVKRFHVDGFHILGAGLPMELICGDSFLTGSKIFYDNIDECWSEGRLDNTLYAYNAEYANTAKTLLNHYAMVMRDFVNQQRKQGNRIGFVNYFANVDGYTLADLFMYNDRHNEDNGENNMDGSQYNLSNNYGIEGPSRKKQITKIRDMKWKNAIIMLLMGQGVPMIVAGDEMDNSQAGNNNAYCQDNKLGWVNWKSDKATKKKLEFFKFMMNFRISHSFISKEMPFRFGAYDNADYPDVSYHGSDAWISEKDLDRDCIGIMYSGEYASKDDKKEFVYVGYNFFSGRNLLALPILPDKKKWYRVCDSSLEQDWLNEKAVLLENQEFLQMEPQAISILVGR